MMVWKNLWSLVLVLVLNCVVRGGGYQDSYTKEAKQTCSQNSGLSLSCLKYEILLFFHRIFATKRKNVQVSSVKLVSLPDQLQSSTNFSLLSGSLGSSKLEGRGMSSSEWSKFVGFLDREASHFVETHALQIPMPEWVSHLPFFFIAVYRHPPDTSSHTEAHLGQGRGRGRATHSNSYKKFYLLFPLIAVFKFLIIKVLLIPILVGVFAIKKMLVAAAMALPTLVQLFRCRNPLNPNAPPPGFLVSALQGYTSAAEPLVTDYSHYGYPHKLHPPPALHPLYAHHAQWENLKNYKSHEQFD